VFDHVRAQPHFTRAESLRQSIQTYTECHVLAKTWLSLGDTDDEMR